MQFTLLAAVVLALAQVQVSASPIDITRSATYMTYATYYVDPWVVMQGERAASTASTAAVSAVTTVTDVVQSAAASATDVSSSSTVTSVLASSTVTSVVSSSTATELTASSTVTASASELSSASKVATDAVDFATDEYAYPNAMYTARSMTRGQPVPTSTEEEQYYHAQTQSAA